MRTEHAENAPVLALDLAAEKAYVTRRKGLDVVPQDGLAGRIAIPPSAILPRLSGEPIRSDFAWPPHPRGCGDTWPAEAAVDSKCGAGRVPMAYAWQMLRSRGRWEWKSERQVVEAAECLAAVLRGLQGCQPGIGSSSPIGVIVPNTLQETEQQDLIDAARAEGLNVKLLWRPVAAALCWCEREYEALMAVPMTDSEPLGSLLVVYLGFDSFELTVLDIIPVRTHNGVFLLPARHRPDYQHDSIAGFGFPALLAFSIACLGTIGRQEDQAALWRLLWCSPWLGDVIGYLGTPAADKRNLAGLNGRLDLSPVQVDAFWRKSLEGVGTQAAAVAALLIGGDHLPQFSMRDYQEWCRHHSGQLSGKHCLGAIATGPLTSLPSGGDVRLGTSLLRKLGVGHVPVLLEGSDLPHGIASQGAALYAARLQAGLPTYLDTLPRLQLVVKQNGEPTWIDLLDEEHRFVEGGKLWKRKDEVKNLEIPPNSTELTLAVHHEEYKNVREVTAALPGSVDQKERVRLAVAMEPAQGNARVEVLPETAGLFGTKRVSVNWRRMTVFKDEQGKAKTPDEYLKFLPRIFPDLSPRSSSPARMTSAKEVLSRFLRHVDSHGLGQAGLSRLSDVINALKQKDPAYYPFDATAIGSDGTNDAVVKEFVSTAIARLKKGVSKRAEELLVRALGYTSTDDRWFHKYLVTALNDRQNCLFNYPDIGQHVLTGCGWCLRDPIHIAAFARNMSQRIDIGLTNVNIWLKAMCEILRYRIDATRDIGSLTAESITRRVLEVFENERIKGNGQYKFRHSCLVIVYLLRRRCYEDGYLEPSSDLAQETKSAFRRAIDAHRKGRLSLVQGAVDLTQALKIMIDYIDRKGHGTILLGV